MTGWSLPFSCILGPPAIVIFYFQQPFITIERVGKRSAEDALERYFMMHIVFAYSSRTFSLPGLVHLSIHRLWKASPLPPKVHYTEFLVLKPSSLSARWLQNWLLTNEVAEQIDAGYDGTKMPGTDWEHVGSIPIPVPHWAEQAAILTTPDRETARISEKVQLSIDLLKKRRSSLITAAVTGQIDLREST